MNMNNYNFKIKQYDQVKCTNCGTLTYNTYSKLCNICYKYRNDFNVIQGGNLHDKP